MPFMEQDAIAKVAAGLTPLEDVMPWSRSKGYRVYPLQRLQQASSSGIHVLSLLRQSRCAQSFENTPERFPETSATNLLSAVAYQRASYRPWRGSLLPSRSCVGVELSGSRRRPSTRLNKRLQESALIREFYFEGKLGSFVSREIKRAATLVML